MEYWDLNDANQLIEFVGDVLSIRKKAVGWANNQLRSYPSRVKTGEDIFSEARDAMMIDIKNGKIKVAKRYSTTSNFLFNYMRRVISKFRKDEWSMIPQNQCSDDHSFEMIIDLSINDVDDLNDQEREDYYQKFLDCFIEKQVGLKKDILGVILSDENDLYKMLHMICKEFTDQLMIELLSKELIDQDGNIGINFKKDKPPSSLKLSKQFIPNRKIIYKIIKADRKYLMPELIAIYLGVSLEKIVSEISELQIELKRFQIEFYNLYFHLHKLKIYQIPYPLPKYKRGKLKETLN